MNVDGPAAAATRLTGRPARVLRRPGGALTEVLLAGDGPAQHCVVKHCPDHDAARAEAAGLRWLADSDTVRVPVVHGHDEHWLVIDRIEMGQPQPAAALQLGHALAALHSAGAPAFGAAPPVGPHDAWIGRAPMGNTPPIDDTPVDRWVEWYVACRVLPYLRDAFDRGVLGRAEVALVERACALLPGLAGPDEPPARLHGDLWNGNVLWGSDGQAWLIDPAAHGGHRETDLAMLALFGCPQLDRIVAAYQESTPLADGWQDRVGLHQLFPLLVHVVLFGQAYVGRLVEAARV
jgi:fructosamine-3-kinase